MRTRGRSLAAAAVLATAGSLVVGAGPAAMAQRADTECYKDSICLFQYDNYGGKMYWLYQDYRDTLGTFNNTASSMVNHSGYRFTLFSGKSQTGTAYKAKAHSVDKTFSNNGFDNTAESSHIYP